MITKRIYLLLIVGLLFSCSKKNETKLEETPVIGQVYVSGYESISPDDVTKVWQDGVASSISNDVYYPLPLLRVKLNDLFIFNKDVYVAASELIGSIEVATYWKNGVRTQLASENISSKANSIFVTNESVFVAGTEVSGFNIDAVIWRDGIKTVLQEGESNTPVFANSVFVSENKDVFVAGYQYRSITSTTLLKLWKNGEEIFESTPHTMANSLYISNENAYMAGSDASGTNSVAVYWKDSIPTVLTDGTNSASATAVFVYENDVYVAGLEKSGTYEAVTVWHNGTTTQLTTGVNPAYAHSIFVSDGDVYVAGYEWNGDNKVAMLWINGIANPLTDGSKEAIAYDVFIADN